MSETFVWIIVSIILSHLPCCKLLVTGLVDQKRFFSHFNGAKTCEFNITSKKDGSHGLLSSPKYPRQYDPNIRCEFHFISRGVERVQIIFTDFDLRRVSTPTNNELSPDACNASDDHVTAFVDLNSRMSRVATFCGDDLPPRLMSSRNQLTLEFTSHHNPYHQSNNDNNIYSLKRGRNGIKKQQIVHDVHVQQQRVYKGFQVNYRFITDFDIQFGQKDARYECGFIFNSTVANNGTIQSPNYPGYYPRSLDCHYTFYGKPSLEKVRIFFTYFDVEGEPPCENESRSDYLELSNYDTVDLKMSRYCGDRLPPQYGLESELDFFHLTFHSNAWFDGTGFFGYYQFISRERIPIVFLCFLTAALHTWVWGELYSLPKVQYGHESF